MNEEIVISARIDTGNSIADLEKAEKAVGKLSDNTKNFLKEQRALAAGGDTFAAQLAKINEEVEQGAMSVRDMTKAVKEYQNIALMAGAESPVGQEAIAKAAMLTDEIGDLKAQVNALANDGRNMQAALQLGSTITAGYSAFVGVTALLGSENEDLLKVITKLQAAQSVLSSIEQVRAALEKESFLMLKAKNIQLAIQEKGWLKLAKAMLGHPVFLIGAAIGGIITALTWLTSRESEYEKQVRLSKKATEELIEAEERRTRIAIRDVDDRINSLKAEGKETFELEREKQRLIIETTHKKVQALKETRELEKLNHQQEIAEMKEMGSLGEEAAKAAIKADKERSSEFAKSQSELSKKIQDLASQNHQALEDFKNLGLAHEKEVNDKANENYKKHLEEKKDADQKYYDKLLADAQAQMEYEIRIAGEEVDAYVKKLDEEEKALADFNARNKAALERDTKALIDSQNKIVEDQTRSFDDREAALDRLREARLIKEEEYTERIKALKQEEIDHAIMLAETSLQATTSMQKSIFEISNNLGKQDEKSKLERAKRQFNITKAVNMAEAAIDGAKAITKGIAQFGPPPSPLGIAAIISAGAITALQIAAIASRKFEGGGGTAPSVSGVTSSGGSGEVQGPFPRNENTTQTAGLLNGGRQTPSLRAHVLDSELHETRQLNQMIEDNATV